MTTSNAIPSQNVLPKPQELNRNGNSDAVPPASVEAVPPEMQRELPPHTEVRLVYWLRREYWRNLITPMVSALEQRRSR